MTAAVRAHVFRWAERRLTSCPFRLHPHPTAGALLIARSPDAAAWLSAAFRDGSSSSSSGGGGGSGSREGSRQGRPPAPAPASIRKTYWAVVARDGDDDGSSLRTSRRSDRGGSGSSAGQWLPPAGTISLPVPSSRDPEQLQPALTRYRVLHQNAAAGLAWLQLEPATGARLGVVEGMSGMCINRLAAGSEQQAAPG